MIVPKISNLNTKLHLNPSHFEKRWLTCGLVTDRLEARYAIKNLMQDLWCVLVGLK